MAIYQMVATFFVRTKTLVVMMERTTGPSLMGELFKISKKRLSSLFLWKYRRDFRKN